MVLVVVGGDAVPSFPNGALRPGWQVHGRGRPVGEDHRHGPRQRPVFDGVDADATLATLAHDVADIVHCPVAVVREEVSIM
jgi:hypothetical protein